MKPCNNGRAGGREHEFGPHIDFESTRAPQRRRVIRGVMAGTERIITHGHESK